jgi:hypothetical protein
LSKIALLHRDGINRRKTAAAVALAAVIVTVVVLASTVLLGGAGQPRPSGKSRPLCDNSLCIEVPAGGDGVVGYGGVSTQLIVAPFVLPPAAHTSDPNQEVNIRVREGQFYIDVGNTYPARYAYPRTRVMSVSRINFSRFSPPGPNWLGRRLVTFRGHSLAVAVYLQASQPSAADIARVNAILATIRLAPPPTQTR